MVQVLSTQKLTRDGDKLERMIDLWIYESIIWFVEGGKIPHQIDKSE